MTVQGVLETIAAVLALLLGMIIFVIIMWGALRFLDWCLNDDWKKGNKNDGQ